MLSTLNFFPETPIKLVHASLTPWEMRFEKHMFVYKLVIPILLVHKYHKTIDSDIKLWTSNLEVHQQFWFSHFTSEHTRTCRCRAGEHFTKQTNSITTSDYITRQNNNTYTSLLKLIHAIFFILYLHIIYLFQYQQGQKFPHTPFEVAIEASYLTWLAIHSVFHFAFQLAH